MKHIFWLVLLIGLNSHSNDRGPVISCGPSTVYKVQSSYFAKATFIARQSGNWNDVNTWPGRLPNANDIVGIPSGITVTYNTTTSVKGVVSDGDLIFASGTSSTLNINNGNLIYTGLLRMRPNSYFIKHEIRINGINEAAVVGNGMEPLDSDPGIWAMGAAKTDIKGDTKSSMTKAVGSILKGSNAFTVEDASNWRIGDEITINPTNEIPQNQVDFNSSTLKFSDPYALKYERRVISAISGNRITVSQAFAYDHSVVNNTWAAHVFNITRNVIIGGTAAGRSHWFIRSSQPQMIEYVALPLMGPRSPIRGDRDRGMLKSGRYPLHFHHCMDGSIGSKVTGVAIYDGGNRGFVPHVSNGIYFKDNVVFNIGEDAFFWDFGDVSNGITYDHNGVMLQRLMGENINPSGFFMGLGDDNVCINNFVSRGDRPISGVGGDYEWIADNDSPWRHDNNMSMTGHNGIQWWQNTPWIHLVFKYVAVNMYINEDQSSPERDAFAGGGIHGAYGNNVIYDSCIFYRAPFRIHASAVSRIGFKMTNCTFDGAGSVDYVIQVHGSAIPSGIWNMITKSNFKGYKKAAVQMFSPLFTNENSFKMVGLVDNSYSGKIVEFRPGSLYMSEAWIQNGNAAQIVKQTAVGSANMQTININKFYQSNTSNGSGIAFKLYAGVNKDRLVREDILPAIHLPQVSVDPKSAPAGRHWKIGHVKGVVNPYSEEYIGFITPMVTGEHRFMITGAQAKRLTVNGVRLIDDWRDVNDEGHTVTSRPIHLEVGKKYAIKAESFNNAPPYTFYLSWNYPGISGFEWIDRSQLFPDNTPSIPPTPVNRPPIVSAGGTRITYDTLFKVEGSATDPDGNLASVVWTGSTGLKVSQTLSEADHVLVSGKPGVYLLTITATDRLGLSATNTASVTIKGDTVIIPVDTLRADAGHDQITKGTEVTLDGSQSKGARLVNWYKRSGPASWNLTSQNTLITKANRLTPGVYVFRLKVTGANGKTNEDTVKVTVGSDPVFVSGQQSGSKTCLDGTILTHTVVAGKYTGITQATADALAIQEVNTELAKKTCPLPAFTTALPNGDTLHVFGKFVIVPAVLKGTVTVTKGINDVVEIVTMNDGKRIDLHAPAGNTGATWEALDPAKIYDITITSQGKTITMGDKTGVGTLSVSAKPPLNITVK